MSKHKYLWHDHVLRYLMDEKGFVTSIDMRSPDEYPVRFVLFDTMKHLQKANDIKEKDAIGQCLQPKKKDSKHCLGMILLCLDKIGVGIVTHELFHLGEHLQRIGWDSEKIADTLQVIAVQFWNWFYAEFEREPA